MIHGRYLNQGEDLTDVLKVRQLSLCDAGMNTEEDPLDPEAVNILVDLQDEMTDGAWPYIGCGRILCDVENFRFYIDQIGIRPEFRRKGYGEFALRMLVDKANLCGAKKVWLKLPDDWDLSDPAHEEALRFFQQMHFSQEEERWMSADIEAFHSCCHNENETGMQA